MLVHRAAGFARRGLSPAHTATDAAACTSSRAPPRSPPLRRVRLCAASPFITPRPPPSSAPFLLLLALRVLALRAPGGAHATATLLTALLRLGRVDLVAIVIIVILLLIVLLLRIIVILLLVLIVIVVVILFGVDRDASEPRDGARDDLVLDEGAQLVCNGK